MILMHNIIREGHETLKKKAQEVTLPISSEDKATLISMLQYVMNSQESETAKKYNFHAITILLAQSFQQNACFCRFSPAIYRNSVYR